MTDQVAWSQNSIHLHTYSFILKLYTSFINQSWNKTKKQNEAKLQSTGPLIYISLNHKSAYCVIFRSSKDFDTCKKSGQVALCNCPQSNSPVSRSEKQYKSWGVLKTQTLKTQTTDLENTRKHRPRKCRPRKPRPWQCCLSMGFDKTQKPSQLTPYKINGKIKIKKAQNYQWDPIQVHQ